MNTKFDPNVMAQLLVAADMPIDRKDLWKTIYFDDKSTHIVSPQIARSVLHVNYTRTGAGEDRTKFQQSVSKSYASLVDALRLWGGVD